MKDPAQSALWQIIFRLCGVSEPQSSDYWIPAAPASQNKIQDLSRVPALGFGNGRDRSPCFLPNSRIQPLSPPKNVFLLHVSLGANTRPPPLLLPRVSAASPSDRIPALKLIFFSSGKFIAQLNHSSSPRKWLGMYYRLFLRQ